MAEFDDRVVFVTGAAQGIGLATARLFATRGATVVFADIDHALVKRAAAACANDTGAQTHAATMDLRARAEVDAVVHEVYERYGRIDALANIAAIFPTAPALETTDDMWDDVLKTNLTGTFYICRAIGRLMLAAGHGSIVNIASGAAFMANRNLAAYSASKAGVIGFSRVLAFELAPAVRVNVVAPGPTNTPRTDGIVTLENVPMGRRGQPGELAEAIAFLSSDRASFMTGSTMHVNGGKFMG